MTAKFLITLDSFGASQTADTKALRQQFENAWLAAAPAVLAVPGIKLVYAGRFANTMEGADDSVRKVIDNILTTPLMTQDPPPAPQPL